MIWFFCGLLLGTLLGRVYGWMKYRYPEFQEVVKLKETRLRRERMAEELKIDRIRAEQDEILNQQLK
jgi:hypothetical protein